MGGAALSTLAAPLRLRAAAEKLGVPFVYTEFGSDAYNAKEDILNPHFLVRGPEDHDWLQILGAG